MQLACHQHRQRRERAGAHQAGALSMANVRAPAGSCTRLVPNGFPEGQPAIGWCTVTSLVPSGKVASTWISGIISAMPSMTSARVSRVVP
jgi:hypothetical protein